MLSLQTRLTLAVLWVPSWALHHQQPTFLQREDATEAEVETEDGLQAILPAVRQVITREKNVTILDVGANDGDFTAVKNSNNPVNDVYNAPNVRAVLVEPNPPVFDNLVSNMKMAYNDTSRFTPVNFAVCPNVSGEVTFYRVNEQFQKDHPNALHFLKYQCSSMYFEHVREQLMQWCGTADNISWAGCPEPLTAEAAAAYIEELRVPCKTPGDLLGGVGIGAASVNILKVDAEGFDAGIVNAFLAIPSFSPALVIFESKHMEMGLWSELIANLKKHGYQISCRHYMSKTDRRCAVDTVAYSKKIDVFAALFNPGDRLRE